VPQTRRGQLISFAVERDADQRFQKWIRLNVKHGQTIASIAAKFGNPEDALAIKKKNGVRGVNYVLWRKLPPHSTKAQRKAFKKRKQYKTIWVPGNFRAAYVFHALAGDTPPIITTGYAKFTKIDRPERAGLVSFDGYDPIEMKVPIRFESDDTRRDGIKRGTHDNGQGIEKDCALLDRMAGRGQFAGAATGPPPIITVSTTGGTDKDVLPLIPLAYQVSTKNPLGPHWHVVDIEWDDSSALRNKYGNRIRQLATVTLWEHINLRLKSRSATTRQRTRHRPAPRAPNAPRQR
jgi:hypothetical protein